MAGEYKGKSIFSHRYIGMSEEAMRNEIDRLQERVYELECALDTLKNDDKDFCDSISENQQKMERMVKEIDSKITQMQSSIDYNAPVKSHFDKMAKDISGNLKSANKESIDRIVTFLQVDTFIIIVILFMVIYKNIVM